MLARTALVMVTFLGFAIVGACKRATPQLPEEGIQRIRAAMPGISEKCLNKLRMKGLDADLGHTDQCFEMMKPQLWRGLWVDAFEGQRFCPAPAQNCLDNNRKGRIWITFPNDTPPTGLNLTDKTYVIQFIGRRTLVPGMYGHMGMSEHEIIVDKMLLIAPMQP